MGSIIVAFLAFFIFAVCTRLALAAAVENVKLRSMTSHYSIKALRVSRSYRIAAFAFLALVSLTVMIQALVQVYFS